jgi:CubicO group peptidase (beta-lactamase class C family)
LAAALLLPMTMMAAGKQDAAVDAILRDYAGDVPGASVVVIRNGKVVLKKSYGLANLEEKRKATPKTNYRLASVTKQFTATAILILADQGKLSLDDALPKFFPDFPAYGAQITIRHLLNHTSGLPDYEDHLPPGSEPVLDADVLEILKRQERGEFPPSAQFRYSNSGYALLALIVERVSAMPFPEYLRRNIFAPLGMRHTYLNLRPAPRDSRRAPQKLPGRTERAYGYSRRENGWERTDQSRTSYVLGDGGIYSSVEDLVRWEAELAAPRLVRPETRLQSMSATTKARALGEDRAATQADGELSYGYGWFVGTWRGEPVVWHGGSTRGFRTHILRVPGHRLTVILLTNRNEGDVAALARQVAALYLD